MTAKFNTHLANIILTKVVRRELHKRNTRALDDWVVENDAMNHRSHFFLQTVGFIYRESQNKRTIQTVCLLQSRRAQYDLRGYVVAFSRHSRSRPWLDYYSTSPMVSFLLRLAFCWSLSLYSTTNAPILTWSAQSKRDGADDHLQHHWSNRRLLWFKSGTTCPCKLFRHPPYLFCV